MLLTYKLKFVSINVKFLFNNDYILKQNNIVIIIAISCIIYHKVVL